MPRAQGRRAARAGLSTAARTAIREPVRLWQLALAFLAGNLTLHQLPVLPPSLLVLGLCLAGLGVIALTGCRRACLPAVVVLGFCWTAQAALAGLGHRWPPAADGRDVALTGWIDRLPARDAGRTVFSLRVTDAETETPPRRVRLSWYDPAPELEAGQALVVEARLRSPRGLVNPGGFDYERWLFLEGYDATGYVRGGRIDDARYGPGQAWLELRASLVARLHRLLGDPDAAALVTALALGERGDFDDEDWTVLRRTGTSHLVAVSGLHIGLIAALAFWLASRLALRLPGPAARHAPTLAASTSLLVASGYAALAGFSLPTERALLMLVVAQGLLIARRRSPLASGLGLALIAVLLFDPLASLSASFWLSFGAVALLLAASSSRRAHGAQRAQRGLSAHAVSFLRVQWTLTIGLAPLVLWFFGQVSLASIPVNLVAIPVFSLVVVPLSLLTAAASLLGGAAAAVATPADLVAGVVWRGLEHAAAFRLAAFELPRPSLLALWLAIVGVAMWIPPHPLPGRRLVLWTLFPLGLGGGTRLAPGEARVTVLDVGQGLAVAVETARHRLLYDAGPVYRSGFDAGAEIVAPVLADLDRKPLDLMLISHSDSDHAGGAPAVSARYPGAEILAGPDVTDPDAEECRAGQAWRWDRVRFTVLHPPAVFGPPGNETSCVLRIDTLGGSVLLTGDIEDRAEARLTAAGGLDADVVLVPHHGSLTSSGPAFVAAVDPRIAIASAGHDNRWGFPKLKVRERWEGRGAAWLVTGEDGAIDLMLRADGIALTAWRDRRRRYWQPKREVVSGAIDASAL
jgi:competence protein ComEC